MPRTRSRNQLIELSGDDIHDMFRERVCGLHLKNKYYEYATKTGEAFNCPICLNDIKQTEAFCLLICGHHLCFSCQYYMNEPKKCMLCRD